MERTDGKKNQETMRIRMSTDLYDRILAAKVPAGWGEEADSSFARYLLLLGLNDVNMGLKEEAVLNEARLKKAASYADYFIDEGGAEAKKTAAGDG